MPITLQISHPDRVAIGVATGVITAQDLEKFVGELADANAFRYRKIFDVMGAKPGLSLQDLAGFAERLQLAAQGVESGPIALLAADDRNEFSTLFAKLTGGSRPAQVFRSIHAAREWLYANSRIA